MVLGLYKNTKVLDIFSQLSQLVIVIFLPGAPVLGPALHDGKRGLSALFGQGGYSFGATSLQVSADIYYDLLSHNWNFMARPDKSSGSSR